MLDDKEVDEAVSAAIKHLDDAEKSLDQAYWVLYRNGGLYPDQYVAISQLAGLVDGVQEGIEMRSEGHDEYGVNETVKFLIEETPE